MTREDIQDILELVKEFMRMYYGVRSEDGKRFVKTPDLWLNFTQTLAYDTFLFSLFQDASKAMAFMTGILPTDLRGSVQAAIDKAVENGPKEVGNNAEAGVDPKLRDAMRYIAEHQNEHPSELKGF